MRQSATCDDAHPLPRCGFVRSGLRKMCRCRGFRALTVEYGSTYHVTSSTRAVTCVYLRPQPSARGFVPGCSHPDAPFEQAA